MRDVKDTLGIKYNKYTDIYKADNEQLGLLLKYIMWEFGKDVILSDVSELTKKRIEKKSKEIEKQIEEMLEDDAFENMFNSLTQQIKRSHKCWQKLKDNLEDKKKDKKKDNTTTPPTTTPTTTPTETATETAETEDKEEPIEEIEDEYKNEVFYIDKNGIYCTNKKLLKEKIKDSKYNSDDISDYVFKNNKNLFLPNGYMVFSIEEIIKQMEEEKILSTEEEMSLPF